MIKADLGGGGKVSLVFPWRCMSLMYMYNTCTCTCIYIMYTNNKFPCWFHLPSPLLLTLCVQGMRAVARPEDFQESLDACRREATKSFGDDKVLIEKFVEKPRLGLEVSCD